LLKIDPKERLSAAEALEHPFFDAERLGEGQMDSMDRK
jgi:serine/threonine protein kinase